MWVLKESIKQKLLITVRKILRRIFGPTKDSDITWRIKTNDELSNLVRNKNIINYTKALLRNKNIIRCFLDRAS
jgi:hypothetical protein